MTTKPVISLENLQKSYGKRPALQGISFSVYPGEILCLLGPNGAGKSTAINLLSTALKADKGEILYQNRSAKSLGNAYKGRLGIVPQDLAIYEEITAYANVVFFGALYGLKGKLLEENAKEALKFVGLEKRKLDRPKTFSGGMKRRLNLACALVHKPEILILDEPTVGIDPQSRKHILESIVDLSKTGTTVIYTTHYIEEVEEISDRIIILDHGQVIAEGTKEELKKDYGGNKFYEIKLTSDYNLNDRSLLEIPGVSGVRAKEGKLQVEVVNDNSNLNQIIEKLTLEKMGIQSFTTVLPSLEQVFLNLTGRKLRD